MSGLSVDVVSAGVGGSIMVRLVLLVLTVGTLSQYAPGKMEVVVRVRQAGRTARHLPADLPEVDGYLAVLDCAEIGEVWTLRYCSPGGACVIERFLVVDCAGDEETRNWMRRDNILGEIDGATAARWGVVGRGVPDVERVIVWDARHTLY